MDAAIYARLSRKRKRKSSGAPQRRQSGLSKSVELQTTEARIYAEEKLWTVVAKYGDDDISASKFTTKPRPQYNLLIAAIERDEVEIIICTEMTRLYRRLEELLELIKMAERTRLRGIWTTDDVGYDLSTPEGIHQAIGAVNNAMLESAKTSVRVKRDKADAAREGFPSGGSRSFGFEPDNLTLRPSEVEVLIEGRDRYIAGETIRDIVRDLNKRGITTAEGNRWRIENFQRTLLKRRYVGKRVHSGAEYPAAWPAIFTEEEWQLMDARRLSRAWKGPKGSSGTRSYLLTGFIYCGRCGGLMYGSCRQLPDGSRVRRYRCRAFDNFGKRVGCGRMYRAADPLEAWITEAVFYRFDSPEVAKALASSEEPGNTDQLMKDYQAAKANLDQMIIDYATRLLDRTQFALAKTVAEAELERAKGELVKAQKTSEIPVGIEALRESWEVSGLDWKRSVIQLLVDRVTVNEGHPGSHEWQGWRFQPELVEVRWRV